MTDEQRLEINDANMRKNEAKLGKYRRDLNDPNLASRRRVNLKSVLIYTELMFDLHNERKAILASGMYLSISSN